MSICFPRVNQPLPEAAATQERTLEAVRCKPSLGSDALIPAPSYPDSNPRCYLLRSVPFRDTSGVDQLYGRHGLGSLRLEPTVKSDMLGLVVRRVGLPPRRALPQSLHQHLIFACQREIVQSAKVAPFHTGLEIGRHTYSCAEQDYRTASLADVLTHPEPGLEESPIAVGRRMAFRSPQDIRVQEHDLGQCTEQRVTDRG